MRFSIFLSWIMVGVSAFGAESIIEERKVNTQIKSDLQMESNLEIDFKTAHYWAYYGQYYFNSELLGEVLSRLSEIESKIYSISKEESLPI